MSDFKITRRGGGVATKPPTITIVDVTYTQIEYTLTNNDALTAEIHYEPDDSTPDANVISLASGATSGSLYATGSQGQTIQLWAFAIASGKSSSVPVSESDTILTLPLPTITNLNTETSNTVYFTLTNPIADNARIYYGTSASPDSTYVDLTASATSGTLNITGLTQDSSHTVYARVYYASSYGQDQTQGFTTELLLAPTINFVSAGYNDLTFTLTNNYDQQVTIYYDVNDTTPDYSSVVVAASSTSANRTISGLNDGTSYTIYARAYDGTNYSANDTEVQSTVELPKWFGDRAVFGGGDDLANIVNNMEYYSIASLGSSTDFGDLTVARQGAGAISNEVRGVFIAGRNSGYAATNVIDYITIATPGNATDFGDFVWSDYYTQSCGNGTYALTVYSTGDGKSLGIFNISTTGNATDFGYDLLTDHYWGGACGNTSRGVFGGGSSGNSNAIEYVLFTTPATGIDFGDLTVARHRLDAASNTTRGIFAGGYNGSYQNVMDYITIATTGNATDFGDLTSTSQAPGVTNNATRLTINGGYSGTSIRNVKEYVTIATTGNATNFGTLLKDTTNGMALSGN